jgi:hypothetical protein
MLELHSNRFKRVIEIQTCVLEKGRAPVGKICDFFGAEILPPWGHPIAFRIKQPR